jgi:polyglycine hydrolase-like protein
MRAQRVAMGPLARPAASIPFLLLSLLLGGTLLGGPAWAAGSVTFNHMSVERCPESSCEWRLACGVDAQQETELFTGADARTKYKVNINRTLEVRQFPATIHCTAWEDDGWFGTSWEKVGSGSLEVPSGGDFRFDISNREQGTVRIEMSVDSLEIAVPAPAAPPKRGARPAPALQFAAAFNSEPEGHSVVVGLEWKPFKALVDKLASDGIHIEDVETFEHGGKRLWNGIFRRSQEQVLLLADQDWDRFSGSWKKLTGGKMRLTDVEVYRKGSEAYFAGIYRDLGEGHSFWVGQTRKDFLEKVKELADTKGLRPLDSEAYRSATGALLYAGAFRQSSLDTQLWTNLNRAALEAKVQGLRGKEWQVIDLETYKEGKERTYDALVRVGTPGGQVVIGLDAAAFAARWREMAAKGLRLVSLEVYQE